MTTTAHPQPEALAIQTRTDIHGVRTSERTARAMGVAPRAHTQSQRAGASNGRARLIKGQRARQEGGPRATRGDKQNRNTVSSYKRHPNNPPHKAGEGERQRERRPALRQPQQPSRTGIDEEAVGGDDAAECSTGLGALRGDGTKEPTGTLQCGAYAATHEKRRAGATTPGCALRRARR